MATDEQIGQLCVNVVNRFAGPNVNARTMLQSPEYWIALVKALRGETEEGQPAPVPEAAPLPELTSVEPNNADVEGDDLTVTLRGTGFMADSVIVFDGNEVETTMKSPGELNTIVEPSLYSAGIVDVKVKTGDHETTALSFTFTVTDDEEEGEDKPKRARRAKK